MRRSDGPSRSALAATTTLLALVAMATVAVPAVVASRSDAVVLVTARQLLAGGVVRAASAPERVPESGDAFSRPEASAAAPHVALTVAEHLLDLPPPTA